MNLQYLMILVGILSFTANASESICYGTTSNGRLEGGVKLPSDGSNFVSYSTTAEVFGRTYVHSEVNEIMLAAYKWLESETPGKVYKYAETGLKDGGAIQASQNA